MINLQNLIRTNIRELISCAETKAEENVRDSQHIMLDANENPYNKPFNRLSFRRSNRVERRTCQTKRC